eukprot:comp24662_c0_seq1/m.46827 comp24662_c0_seq1/g.46827  ORF comp24662_c0_seq1/g.46827 comp24662_c0_seq1/m.46827 type:complete len:136 (-) comp24662_c0_seq1:542-949(-)
MPSYEACLIFKRGLDAKLPQFLQNTANIIMTKGGVVRKMENLGADKLPHRMRAHLQYHEEGQYMAMQFDVGSVHLRELNEKLLLSHDIIRHTIVRLPDPKKPPIPRFHKCKNKSTGNDIDETYTVRISDHFKRPN